jgi:hypothetical protein
MIRSEIGMKQDVFNYVISSSVDEVVGICPFLFLLCLSQFTRGGFYPNRSILISQLVHSTKYLAQ